MTTPTQPLPGRIDGPAAHAEIRRFVTAVEAALDDLPSDDVAELVGGLEADLTEAWVAEGTSPAHRFGSPEAYAADLRAAAGLPPRLVRLDGRQGFWVATRSVAADLWLTVQQVPGWSALRDLAITLRPVWWVARGYAAYLLAVQSFTRAGAGGHLLPLSNYFRAVLLILVLASVELGRRSLTVDNTGWRAVLIALNVTAFGTLVFLGGSDGRGPTYVYVGDSSPPQTGLYNGDYKVVNVFPYGKDGKPLTDVQLFDDRGRPLEIGSDGRSYVDKSSNFIQLVPGIGTDGQQKWNVFPMRELPRSQPGGAAAKQPRDASKPDPVQGPLLIADTKTDSKTSGEK